MGLMGLTLDPLDPYAGGWWLAAGGWWLVAGAAGFWLLIMGAGWIFDQGLFYFPARKNRIHFVKSDI